MNERYENNLDNRRGQWCSGVALGPESKDLEFEYRCCTVDSSHMLTDCNWDRVVYNCNLHTHSMCNNQLKAYISLSNYTVGCWCKLVGGSTKVHVSRKEHKPTKPQCVCCVYMISIGYPIKCESNCLHTIPII